MDRTLAGLDQPQGISQAPEPDFICIGMQKAGTGWLFDQLQFHPDFWMPPVKQLHYLEHERTKTGTAEKFLRIARRNPVRRKMRLSHRREWDERDVAFLEQYVGYDGEPMDIEKYIALFRYKGNCLSGEINSGYSGLGEETISALAQRLPDLRVFIILRDPVARGWSQVSMAYRNGEFRRSPSRRSATIRGVAENLSSHKQGRISFTDCGTLVACSPETRIQTFLFRPGCRRARGSAAADSAILGSRPLKSRVPTSPPTTIGNPAIKSLNLATGSKWR